MFRNLRKRTKKILNWKKKSKINFFLAALVSFFRFIISPNLQMIWKKNYIPG